ncbi:MAG TPA: ChuX/HutX family heme-like substrate-binding protein [Methylophilaceae bacterium]|nr:ChuX/HutX family heme-like substrate-binding protein [Methylophilaceae bacterium]
MTQLATHEVQYQAFRQIKQVKKLRNREAAQAIGISECEAIANSIGREAIRLRGPFHEIIAAVPRLGRVMALTRNESTVHEKIGTYENVSYDHVGMVLGREIDMRIFYSHWKHGYAVTEQSDKGEQHSLQFFDASGTAVHKIHLKEFSNLKAWHWLVEAFEHPDQSPGQTVEPIAAPAQPKPESEIDQQGFASAWLAMKDTHDFFMVMRKFGVNRIQAMRMAPADHAYQVDNNAVKQILETAAADGTSIMCFVGNPGNIQIHTGAIQNVKEMGPWINVLDDGFNLHLRTDLIAQSWVVKKPTVDGMVTSLELYDADGEMMAQFFGERKPGKPELEAWRNIVAQLPLQAANPEPALANA